MTRQVTNKFKFHQIKKAVLFSATLGTLEVDVMSIAQQFLFIFYQLPLGVAISGNIYPGHFLGANKPAEAINACKVFTTIIRLLNQQILNF